MPTLFIFLLKVNIALIIFCMGYYLVLRRLTFYTLNRIYLVAAIVFSSVYPLIDVDGFAQRHQQLTYPVQTVIMSLKTPAANFVKPIAAQPDYWLWLEVIFWAGATLFAIRLLIQLISLYKMYKTSKPGYIQDHEVRIVNADIGPFSFWQSIYINPDNLNAADLKSILQHEQVHIKQWHTLDIMLSELSAIFYWFNPGVWLMKKAVRENIEFITDRKILQKGIDTKAYQYSLLNVSFSATTSAGITNHFNFSTLKKRIIMMNAKRSSNVNLTRYAFLVPTVIVCLFAFSLSKAEIVKQSKDVYKTITASVKKLDPVTVISHNEMVKTVTKQDTTKKIRKTITIVNSPVGKADTGEKVTFNLTKTDATDTYTINNKPVTKLYFYKVVPKDIEDVFVRVDDVKVANSMNVRTDTVSVTKTVTVPTGRIRVQTFLNNVDGVKIIKKDSAKTIERETRTYTFNDPKVSNVVITGWDAPNNGTAKTYVLKRSKQGTKPQQDTYKGDLLYIIDGKEASEKDRKKTTTDDIASIVILKDAAAVEQYGEKGKNGVVIIETKKANK